ncbi:YadA family autotransporter adhesin [Paraburkholderia sp. A1BS-2L]|uniref:YadA family autotransporter adhesin n=1 Tax=Paraburkholderia sp. A1BS-2L TaxID=3028373 RepID=UPI003DA7F81B
MNGSQLYAINGTINNINNGGGIKYFHANSSQADSQAIGVNSVAAGGAAIASGSGAVALGVGLGLGGECEQLGCAWHGFGRGPREHGIGRCRRQRAADHQCRGRHSRYGRGERFAAEERRPRQRRRHDEDRRDLRHESRWFDGLQQRDAGGGTGGTQIHNVAAGSEGTDAVNVDQLNNALGVINNSLAGATNPLFVGDGDRQTEAASATGTHSTAMGANAAANADNSVALGANSVADRSNTVSVGSAGGERQVANVAAGTEGTDAVNVNQLKASSAQSQRYTDQQVGGLRTAINDVGRNAYSGVAAATALSMIPDVDLGKMIAVGVGAATYRGYQATALGATARVTQNIKLRVGAGLSSGGTTVGIGASYQW